MPVYRARAEFRRRTRALPWVLAGVIVADRFFPAEPGVEPIRGRLPEAGLVGWAPIGEPILAPDRRAAAATALELASGRWPARVGRDVPFRSGTAGD